MGHSYRGLCRSHLPPRAIRFPAAICGQANKVNIMERLPGCHRVGSCLLKGTLASALLLIAATASALCPAGQAELRPNIRALPPSGIAMRDANNMQFNTTSWNSGDGKLELVAKNLVTDPTRAETASRPTDLLLGRRLLRSFRGHARNITLRTTTFITTITRTTFSNTRTRRTRRIRGKARRRPSASWTRPA